MTNDPMDFEAHAFADRCQEIDQHAQRLEELAGVRVCPCDAENDLQVPCEIGLELDPEDPLRSFAEQLKELAARAKDMAG